jgi:hypothetical protein
MKGELSLQPLSTEYLFEGSQEPDRTQGPRASQSLGPVPPYWVDLMVLGWASNRSWFCQITRGQTTPTSNAQFQSGLQMGIINQMSIRPVAGVALLSFRDKNSLKSSRNHSPTPRSGSLPHPPTPPFPSFPVPSTQHRICP